MWDAGDPVAEERLARLEAELAEHCSSLAAIGRELPALHKRTLQLCDALRRELAQSRCKLGDMIRAAGGTDASACRPASGSSAGPASLKAAGPTQHGLPAARLRRVMDYIDASLAEPLTVPALACIAGMSPSHFTALFKRSTGVTPHEAVLRRRVVKAKELLHEDVDTIAAIGCQLGFSSQAHFTTVFRRRVGVAPSTFRLRGDHADTTRVAARKPKVSANPAIRPVEFESPRCPNGG